jgi:hypothetical protein
MEENQAAAAFAQPPAEGSNVISEHNLGFSRGYDDHEGHEEDQ